MLIFTTKLKSYNVGVVACHSVNVVKFNKKYLPNTNTQVYIHSNHLIFTGVLLSSDSQIFNIKRSQPFACSINWCIFGPLDMTKLFVIKVTPNGYHPHGLDGRLKTAF